MNSDYNTRIPESANPPIPATPLGNTISCKGWVQEAALRMLLNNLDPDVAERPDDLIVYGGRGKAARNHEALHLIIRSLRDLENDESLLIQSGKPVGIMKTHPDAPRVLISNSQLVPNWANWKHFDELEKKGLTMYGQMTAGSWIYIGSQGIVQGTYETYSAAADKHFGGTLKGTINVTAGLGGMGGAQPLAITMNEGVALIAEVEKWRIEKRLETRYLDLMIENIDDAIDRAILARKNGEPLHLTMEIIFVPGPKSAGLRMHLIFRDLFRNISVHYFVKVKALFAGPHSVAILMILP